VKMILSDMKMSILEINLIKKFLLEFSYFLVRFLLVVFW
jgi:hypothetical protein